MNIVLIQREFGRRHFVGFSIEETFTLEQAFEALNGYGPYHDLRQYADYSMSVGDIIGLDGDYYLCDSVGWTPLNEEHVKTALFELLKPAPHRSVIRT